MIIDMHIHVWDEGYQPIGYKMGMAKGAAFKKMPFKDPLDILPKIMSGASDPDGILLIQEMNKFDIDAVVAMVVDMGLAFNQQQDTPIEAVIEQHAKLIAEYPNRFFAFFGMDPRRKNHVALFEDAIINKGFSGLKLYPPCGFAPDDPVCFDYYEKCIELDVPVLFHTANTFPPLDPGLSHPSHLSAVSSLFPDLKVIYGHVGRPYWWQDILHIAESNPNAYLELSGWNHVAAKNPKKFANILREMIDTVGAHRIFMGSDFAAGPKTVGDRNRLPAWLDYLKNLPINAEEYNVQFTDEEIELIMGENAKRMIKL
jgi:predicted TIM-barrel fold metal-dependent hydrolase